MKICWDNLEKLNYKKEKGMWYYKNNTNPLIYIEYCEICTEPFLSDLNNTHKFCSRSCRNKTIKHNAEARKKISEAAKGNKRWLGKTHTNESKNKMKKSKKGIIFNIEWKNRISESLKNENNGRWKGGYRLNNIPLYNTYIDKLNWCELVRKNPKDNNILQVKCTYCGKWYTPTTQSVVSRIRSINGKDSGESRLYCSKECKNLCPIYKKIKYSAEESGTKQLSREVQPELRQMVFERDNYTCIKCKEIKGLQCHHIEGIKWEPIESADIDKCITVCKKCHDKIHKVVDCSPQSMRCNN